MTSELAGLRLVPGTEARGIIARQLVGPSECDQVAIECALLRSCVWALSGGTRPIHILRLLNHAASLFPSRLAGSEDGSDVRARLKEGLEELSDAGDLVALANGRWLPAPTRQVRLGTSDDARLLVGGFPTALLPPDLVSEIHHAGAFRRTKGERLASELGLPSEEGNSWIGETPVDLQLWTPSVLEGHYEAFGESQGGASSYIYAPQLARVGAPQAFRWVDKAEKLSGRFLGRRDLPFGLRQYRALDIVQGRPTRVMKPNFGTGDLRRFMYGLDVIAGNPVVVEESIQGNKITIVIGSELPRPERRLFGALGELIVVSDKYYPRTWRFPVEYKDEVSRRLQALGVRLSSKTVAGASR